MYEITAAELCKETLGKPVADTEHGEKQKEQTAKQFFFPLNFSDLVKRVLDQPPSMPSIILSHLTDLH